MLKSHIVPMLAALICALLVWGLITYIYTLIEFNLTLKGAIKVIASIGTGVLVNNYLSKRAKLPQD